jgi:hypothetical protein
VRRFANILPAARHSRISSRLQKIIATLLTFNNPPHLMRILMSTVVCFSNLVHKICLEMICEEMSERMTGRNSGREPGPGMALFSFDLLTRRCLIIIICTGSRINKPGRGHTTTVSSNILKLTKKRSQELLCLTSVVSNARIAGFNTLTL